MPSFFIPGYIVPLQMSRLVMDKATKIYASVALRTQTPGQAWVDRSARERSSVLYMNLINLPTAVMVIVKNLHIV